jgi:Zn-dependent protease
MSWDELAGRLKFLPILLVVLLLSLAAHEMAHAWAAYRLGDPTAKGRGRLSLNPLRHLDLYGTALIVVTYLLWGWLFGWAKPVPVSPYYFKNRQRGMAIVGAAGPITNFILAVIFVELLNVIHPSNEWVFQILWLGFMLNVVLGLFNLIPIPPLDGSRVVGAFLPRGAYEKWVAVDQYGMVLVVAVMVIFQGRFSQALGWAIDGLANLFLTSYR